MHAGASETPPIIVKRLENERNLLLLWVKSGLATVTVAGQRHRLSADQALWVPAGVTYSIQTDADSLLFPIFVESRRLQSQVLAVPTRTSFPSSWGDWLVYQFALNLGYFQRLTAAEGGVWDMLIGSLGAAERSSREGSGAFPDVRTVAFPPMPDAHPAVSVAQRLLKDSSDSASVAQLAHDAGVSTRTLQAQFVQGTGMALGTWRTKLRVASAADHLAQGHAIGWTAQHVGFSTGAGFTRAFRRYAGMSPQAFALGSKARQDDGMNIVDDRLEKRAAPPVPKSKTWPRINDFHVLVWVYRGRVRIKVGEAVYALDQGDVAVIPAGVHNSVDLPAGSIVLPLGSMDGNYPMPSEPLISSVDEADESFLLHTVVANYSYLRPMVHDMTRIVRKFIIETANPAEPTSSVSSGEVVAGVLPERQAPQEPNGVSALLSWTLMHPADRTTLPQWRTVLGAGSWNLSGEIKFVTGLSFAQWRNNLRMTLARQMLEQGKTISQVARKLGYSNAKTFGTVFKQHHGISPREYIQTLGGYAKESLLVP